MNEISNSVGYGGENRPDDVFKVKELLNMRLMLVEPLNALNPNVGAVTLSAIRKAQQFAGVKADGRIDPGGPTWQWLTGAEKPGGDDVGQRIISIAMRFVGLTETASNKKWDNPDTPGADAEGAELLAMMQAVGWQAGWPYCAAFVEAVWREAYRDAWKPQRDLIAKRLTPSVMASYQAWRGEIVQVPKPGAIFFMQSGNSGNGHCGIVVKPGSGSFSTVEGNTSPAPGNVEEDRNGDGVYRKVRRMDFSRKSSGLWLRGFLNPPEFRRE